MSWRSRSFSFGFCCSCRPVWIRAVTGPGLGKQKERHVTRGFDTPSPLSPFPVAVSGWHGVGWGGVAGESSPYVVRTSWIVFHVFLIRFNLFLRFLLDRAYSDLNGLFQSLDSEPDISLPASPLHTETTSQTVTSTHTSSSSQSSPSSSHTTYSDLRQILRNIKTYRWRHFKPRTLTSQSGAGDALSQRPFRGLVRGGAGPGGSTLGRTAGMGPPAVGKWTQTH